MKNLKITVIGAGALGKAIAYKLKEYGFNLAGIAGRNNTAVIPLEKAHKTNSDIYIFAVPDKAIVKTAKKIAKHFHSEKILIHLSGCLSSDILKIDKDLIAASCHPIGSFKNFDASLKTLQNAHWTLEGDKTALEFMKSFIKKLSGNYYMINKKHKALYHSACTLASSGLLTLIYASCGMLNNVGNGRDRSLQNNNNILNILWPLISSSLDNLKDLGFPAGLTGPWVRGDKKTIKLHKTALKNYDGKILKLYNILGARHRTVTHSKHTK